MHGASDHVPAVLPRLAADRALGRVRLPLHLNWPQPGREFDLADRRQRARVYEIVLREGSGEDISSYVDGALLVDLWPDLILPARSPARVGALVRAVERAGARIHVVEAEIVSRAMAAATELAGELHLRADDAVVIHNSNKLALHLLPCGVFARVALAGQEVAALEVELALRLAGTASPVAALKPRVEPRVYERDGFAATLWTYYEVVAPDLDLSGAYADVLQRLHTGMRRVEIAAPHFLDRAAEAKRLVTHRDETPALAEADRHLLLSTLQSARERIHSRGAGESSCCMADPIRGNLLSTRDGLLFIDFETCCRGPIEFDVAHVPDEVSARYPGVDQVLLAECRRLVLAMVAA